MLATILAVQQELRQRLVYMRAGDIFVAPSVYYLPPGAKTPCIGIKDGRPTRRELGGGVVELTLPVHIAMFVRLAKDASRSIIGEESQLHPGILQIEEDVLGALVNNRLNLGGVISALVTSQDESEMFIDASSGGIQRKQVTVTYTKETPCTC